MRFNYKIIWVCAVLLLQLTSCKKFEVEGALSHFNQLGEFEVTVIEENYDNNDYRIYYPESYTEQLPIVVWGNGSDALPDDYDGTFKHIASHGFLLIDTYEKNTGTGKEINEAIEAIIAINANPDHGLYDLMDTTNLALVGHSQGSTGVINTYTDFNNQDKIKAITSIALPSLRWCDPEDVYDASKINVPYLIIGGTKDYIISPTRTNEFAFDATPNIQAALLMVRDAGHNEIQQTGKKHIKYLMAWLELHLKSTEISQQVFKGPNAAIHNSSDLKSVATKGL